MKLLSFQVKKSLPRAGLLTRHGVVDLAAASQQFLTQALPDQVLQVLRQDPGLVQTQHLADWIESQDSFLALALENVSLCPPVLFPGAMLDFYTFEQHVATCRAKRGLEVVPEWYQYPVYYNGNPRALVGHGVDVFFPKAETKRDYELELAIIIGKEGRDIPRESAHEYIAGYTILNDWSARAIQAEVMKVGLGPAKGKDFASSLGPWLVTPDEIGDPRDLTMVARVNGEEWSRGNSGSSYYRFEEMIAFASEGVTLYPGDLLGSGTVGTGCGLELGKFLQPGDWVELEIEKIGTLANRVF
ncbi:fumarylacetoacetase [bacterium (Candidatus Blackallbacteria) CG17_big_fil_post_rev_8_21_14_2_50_48_46]|uniref:Fumarylacetoacetase n=1 Tax=bacterium (Candidatus Blackallbacteria) CG17_big_fil_post_rev_8_21_14_2_50_48_46 TaxID=2014261 RepID=A0A2M7G5F5_9BACT|nr:MAG: fumarylacetoacetase [bacterium (Candidatus Blackallbacteria) CG18_big_fil_WC_8_21_14_2_50_49_26]PIW17195.1 MAG: fumarylacetoacetase [bacterium (Candidatus Blackallbacteria) CG17_big_fil_post_rev_8_21_14_2_50_48_46]PIW50986.1 MAG: fumarylacetoacetase [bacterium (Candidatus Blackallbacteria) CG13_big_fil_rev_8_21_14_2_50_49_14]